MDRKQIIPITSGIFQQNCFIVENEGQALIIDPGEGFQKAIEILTARQLKPAAILCTHGHIDHVQGVAPLQEQFQIPFYMHSADQYLLDNLESACQKYGLPFFGTPKIEVDLAELSQVNLAGLDLKFYHTPGHTPGGMLIGIGKYVFCGDTIFYRGIGRTDFPGGSFETLQKSIRQVVYRLPDDTELIPGHSRTTTVGEEKYQNPFIRL
jgi:hydroxyacylglutathione hydrolase